jgi:hypothetical protein
MIARTAACAAWLFAWSVCAEIHGGGLSFAAAASAVAQEIAQERVIATLDPNIVEGATQVARRQDADVAAPSAGTEPSPVNQAVFPQPALTPEATPFGLAAERVSEGEILSKWTGVESEIRKDGKFWRAAAKTHPHVRWRHSVSLPLSMRAARAAAALALA